MKGTDARVVYGSRAAAYVRGRPAYPLAALRRLSGAGLPGGAHIADLGAGTGILTGQLLSLGYAVTAVEPNAKMRGTCDLHFGGHPRYQSIGASAEATTLPDRSMDAVSVGQALHWFVPEPTRAELARILRPRGIMLFIWNVLDLDEYALGRDIDALLQALPDYSRQRAMDPDPEALARAASPLGTNFAVSKLAHQQRVDREAFCARFVSTSYFPSQHESAHRELVRQLSNVFESHQTDGAATLRYRTCAITGIFDGGSYE